MSWNQIKKIKMFKKLRNRVLIINLTIISLVMVTAFATIYFITYNNIHSEIQGKLNAQSGMQISTEIQSADEGSKSGYSTNQYVSMSDPLMFSIEINESGDIVNINSFIDLPKKAYISAAETAWKDKNSREILTIGDRKWQYAVGQIQHNIVTENGQQYTSTENNYMISFFDVTSSLQTLLQLLTTLLLVGLAMLVMIYFISLFFANRAIRPIAEAWEKQKQFVADASHELKTPLSIINANYDALLANQEETVKSQIKWLDYIKIGTDRMTSLISELLSLARIENMETEIVSIAFNFTAAVVETVSSMEAVLNEKTIRLAQSVEPDVMAKGDAEKVKQVVSILLENAVKYTDENGQIEIVLSKLKHQVIFSVKNSGKGIKKEDLPKVFDRFYRADSSRTYDAGSFGLGLPIAKAIIEKMGGDIHADSIENETTTFTFSLES